MKRIIASVLVGATMLTSMPIANSYVLPVIDGAKMMQDAINWAMDAADRAVTLSNWVTQLQNWRTQLQHWVRGQMEQIPELIKKKKTQLKKCSKTVRIAVIELLIRHQKIYVLVQ